MGWMFYVLLGTLAFWFGVIYRSDWKALKDNIKEVVLVYMAWAMFLVIVAYFVMPILNFWKLLIYNTISLVLGYGVGQDILETRMRELDYFE